MYFAENTGNNKIYLKEDLFVRCSKLKNIHINHYLQKRSYLFITNVRKIVYDTISSLALQCPCTLQFKNTKCGVRVKMHGVKILSCPQRTEADKRVNRHIPQKDERAPQMNPQDSYGQSLQLSRATMEGGKVVVVLVLTRVPHMETCYITLPKEDVKPHCLLAQRYSKLQLLAISSAVASSMS